jgi:hypothetical protein
LRRHGEYRVGGPGVASEEFRLPAAGGVELDIKTGPRGQRIVGTVMLIGGPSVALVGLITFAIEILVALPSLNPDRSVFFAGGGLAGTGVGILLIGGIVYGTAGTSVRLSPVSEPMVPVRLTAGLRLSTRGLEF